MNNKKNINIGSCGFQKNGWINLDKPSAHYFKWQKPIDLKHDLMTYTPIALENNSIEIAYTSHTIEHLSDEFVEYLFREVYRILENNGVFRIACPNIDKLYDAYIFKDHEYINLWKKNAASFIKLGIGERFLFLFACYISPYNPPITEQIRLYRENEIEEIFRIKNKFDALTFFTTECQKYIPLLQKLRPDQPYDHISWWGFDRLKLMLEKIGFKNIERQTFDCSNVKELKCFDSLNEDNVQKRSHTLIVECTK